MGKKIKSLCLILVVLMVLELPVILLWNRVSHLEARLTQMETEYTDPVPEPETTVPQTTETVPPETTVPETEPPKITIDQVPQYFQNDYPDELYGTGTVATSGSNMTALAMVASYLTDHNFYPDEMADYLAHFIGGHYQRLEYGSDLLQLSWKRAENIHEALAGIRDGKVAYS